MVGKAIDSLVGLFSPQKQLARMTAREIIEGKRMYAAARPDRLHGGWSPVDQDVNDEIRVSSERVRKRVRQLVRDFPYFDRAVQVLTALTVGGSGHALQSMAPGGRETRCAIEDAFRRWSEQADITGRMTFAELCQLAKRQECENGEFFFILRQSKDKRRYIPFCLQAIEADRLTDTGTPRNPKHEIDQGVEYNPTTGEIIAYHFDDDTAPLRVPADQIIHGFPMLRPGQLRGISPFAAGVLAAHDLGEYLGAEIEGAKMAAKYLAFVETPDIANFQQMRGVTVNSDTNQREEQLENAVMEYLRPGEKITLASHNRPGDNFEPFTRLVLRMLSITTGVPYELLSGDYSGVNYSTMRVCRNDLNMVMRVPQARMTTQLCNPVFREVIRQAVLHGQLTLPGFWQQRPAYMKCKWIAPGMESIDPYKETKAHVDQLGSLLRSPQEIAAARGRDYEEILDEIQEAHAMAEERGLSTTEISTALASNPAAIEGDDAE